MLNPYKTVGKTLALFKAAGLAVPAYGENEKRRLLAVSYTHLTLPTKA